MNKFIKYYSYNQLIEKYDILVMTQQEYLDNKNNLDNPQMIVCVNREGGVKKPKMPEWFKQWNENVYEKQQPKWFQSYKKEADARFEKIEKRLSDIENKLDGSKPPKWFTDYMEEFAKKNNLRFEKIEDVLRRNNLK